MTINTECAHCQKPIHITVNSAAGYAPQTDDTQLLLFEPDINWDTFTEPNIIHAY